MEAKEECVKIERAEIDTRPPFRSVKEAVSLFGAGVLAADVNTHKLQQTIPTGRLEIKNMTDELEETKQNLEKARHETELMTIEMSSLKEELDHTRRELQQLKDLRESKYINPFDSDEDLKFVKDSPKSVEEEEENINREFQKKRYVTFSHPTLSQIILPEPKPTPGSLDTSPIMKSKKKKNSFTRKLPLIARIFPKRKPNGDM